MRALILAFVLIISNVPSSQAQPHPLVGTWRATAITQAGKQQVEIVIQANGTYSQRVVLIVNFNIVGEVNVTSGHSFRNPV